MTQDMNHTFVKALRAVFVAAIMLLTGSHALAQTQQTGVRIYGNVYGGGNAADVKTDATVNITAGTMVNVYGGGKGQNTTVVGDVKVKIGKFTNSESQVVAGVATITGSVYGGSALGTVNAEVTKDPTTGVITDRVASANKSTSVNIYRSTINGSIYGGGEGDSENDFEAQVCKEVIVTIGSKDNADDNPTIKGSVYGGCNANGVLWEKSEVNVVRGTIGSTDTDNNLVDGAGNVHGGGFGQKTLVKGDVEVNIGATDGATTPAYSGYANILGDVYGGSAKGNVNAEWVSDNSTNPATKVLQHKENTVTDVNLYGGTVNGDVYGGGLGDNTSGSEVAANVYGPVTVGIYGGTARNVFGCNNHYGSPQDNVIVNIAGGTVNNNVFGGGQEADALGQITVNVTGGTVTNDVYGGGALADTNTANWDATNSKFLFFEVTELTVGTSPVTGYYTKTGDDYTLITASDAKAENGKTYYSHYTTTVNLTGGTIGNAYGGALGSTEKAANVWGDVYLTVDGTAFTISNDSYTEGTGDNVTTVQVPKSGRVFGCNNINGTPKREVTVHVKQTVPSGGGDHTLGAYEIAAVYGGGNLAPYEPKKAETESTVDGDDFSSDDTKASTNVIIDGCGDTSIGTVYGGGNAASTPSTKVTVNGAYEIGELFGGGNGKDKIKNGDEWKDNPGAHVGFKAYTTESEKDGKKYGSGQARVNIYGGKIHAVYGGSNTLGNVRRVAVAMLDEVVSTCPIAVDEAYGGGKSADMDGKAILNLGCIPGLKNVYGGARAATVNNNVVLNITNGTYENVFGGNNESGNINGSITVNVEETGCRPVHITNLYGGGNKAPYPGATSTLAADSENRKITVNVKSCTSIGNIFGGGLGDNAIVTGNTEVNINQIKGKFSKTSDGYAQNTYGDEEVEGLGTIGNVYGGGSQGKVVGNTSVNIGTVPTVTYVTGTNTTTAQNVQGVNITGSVYGGGLSADVEGNSVVKIGTATLAEGAIGVNIAKDVFGGGEGKTTNVSGNVTVEVGKDNGDQTFSGNATIGTNTYAGSVYGGSALGSVNTAASGNNAASGTVIVNLHKGTVKGAVYGGGMGEASVGENPGTEAKVFGDATVTLYGDVVTGGLYGGCNLNGTMYGNTVLNLYGGTVGAVLSAGASAPDMVFGGGLGKDTKVNGNVTVNIGDADNVGSTIYSNVYGGSAKGIVNSSATNTTTVNLFKGIVYGDVFGGGLGDADNAAEVKGKVVVNLNDNNGTCVVAGSIFGCNNTNGSPEDDVEVHIYNTVHLDGNSVVTNPPATGAYELQAVYGGGKSAEYSASGKTTKVIIETCDPSIEEVYGGGYGADVPATNVEVKGAYEIGTVFGGGYGAGSDDPAAADYNPGANVNGITTVLLEGGTIHEAYGGSNTKGDVTGGTNVNVSDNGNTSCPLKVEQIYGGGKNAQMTGGTNIILGCQPDDWIEEIYAGAQAADVGGSVGLTITSGKFERVFGGNKTSGKIKGSITVNIEETGTCATPIIIGELYGGGYQAGYSIYGYNNDNTPRTKAQYDTWYAGLSDEEKAKPENKPYSNPQLNVRSFTSIGAIYGGGYEALMVADPTVSINVVKGSHADDNDLAAGSTQPNSLPYPAHKKGAIGTIGNVFGGGNLATVEGSATVNIGTEKKVQLISLPKVDAVSGDPEYDANATQQPKVYQRLDVEGANITGNVYGGGNLADITGNTHVNICAKYDEDDDEWKSVTYGTGLAGVTIGSAGVNDKDHGHVFGGGKGVADNFTCDKAMVGTEDAGMVAGYLYGNTGVTIGNGTIYGNVYGGGEVGRVEMNTTVKIGIDDGSAPVIEGSVYGAGQGVDTHGYSGLARGNSRVTIDGEAWVKGSVYGGGEKASVGRYWVNGAPDPNHEAPTVPSGLPEGMPYALKDPNSGKCYVTIQGHAKIGPTTLTMPTFLGNVFGGCKGILPGAYSYADNTTKPKRWVGNDWSYFANEAAYIQFIRTLAMNNETHVTIDENAFVKGSVYGGSENGGVLDNTYVTIAGGQIGCGEGYDAPYTDWSAASLPECPHWTYGIDTNNDNKKDLFAPYDKFAKEDGTYDYTDIALPSTEQQVSSSEGGRPASKASDGHTFYGNVFGGGSGKDPYKPGKWLMTAGGVGGNTNVTITGGHILTSVYGGNELTNVGEELVNDETKNKGKCIIRMSGGSIGVPRMLQQILDHPVTCNLFGAGKGDQRVLFNKWTNVNDVDIQITGGTIYGSVFGGGEDGHVMRDVKLEIGQASGKTTMIGTLGTSGFEGNVFGGGRGFGGDAYTAGNVAGSVDLDITGGTMLGSVYGGGRLASVGYGLYDKGVSGYGEIREDNKNDNGDVVTYFTTTSSMNKLGRGHINIDISGGTIGNTSEFVYPTAAQKADDGDLRNTSYDQTTNRLLHTKGGNVFAGGMGRRTLLSGDPITADIIDWHKLGNAKSTKLTIRQASENVATIIRGNVYGGGELGTVLGNHQLYNGTTAVVDANNIPVMAGTEIVISGGTIGTQVAAKTGDGGGDAYYFGSVYGGGMGEIYEEGTGSSATTVLAGGNVNDSTKVSMSNGSVRGSVYGGGELGQVFGSADVAVSGGSIGVSGFGGAEYGNIYGGGKGSTEKLDAGLIKTNTWVTVSGSPQIWHNIYGGGAYGSVGTITRGSDATYIHVPGQTSVPDMPKSWAENTGSALVRILSGTIGRNGNENGMVFGSSRGDVGAPGEIHDKLAWVKKAKVVIGATGTTGPNIKGSVYGSGENGHLFQDAVVEIHSGVVGIAEGEPIGSYTAGGASYPYRGNVFGGGCGTDKYYSNPTGVANPHDGKGDKYNPLAGIVLGDASVTMDGGTVVRNIYGAGAMGSVGTMTTDENNHLVISNFGTTTIAISGGTVGVSGTVGDGNVFGAARGDVGTAQTDVALVKTTGVTISQAEGKTTRIYGNVYGGGALGDVGTYYTISEAGENKGNNIYLGGDESGVCTVTVTGGTIGSEGNTTVGHVFGAGKGDATTYTCQRAMVKGTTVTVSNGTIYGNVYGGGEVGRVEHDAVVTIGTGTGSGPFAPIVHGSVFGAGAGLETHGYSALVRGNSTVTVQGNAKVRKNVYGGGETATVGKYWVSKISPDPNEAPPAGFPDGMPYKTRDGGLCTVTIQGDATVGPDEVANVSNTAGHVFGAGKGVVPHYVASGTGQSQRMNSDGNWESFATEDAYLQFIETLALASNTNVTIGGNAAVKGSVYGGSESGFVQDHTIVTINKGEIGTAGTYAYSNIGNIFGGGRGISGNPTAGRVGRYVSLTVNDGTAHGSVYGGGEMGVVKEDVTVNILGGTIDKDVYGGGALAHTQTGNWDTTNNTLLADKITDGKTAYKTTVNLLGGLIKGDAYGGGLGDLAARGTGHSDVAAMVYGDVFVTLGNETEDATAATATAFRTTYVADDKGAQVVNSGRVFGCNNLNGSPKGNVTVTVNRTVTGKDAAGNNLERTALTRDAQNKVTNAAMPHVYEVAAVYGGGNLANYEPVAGKKPMVRLNTCDISIEEVYGGGNAAMVPETDVLILGAHEIENVFGGGNGEDKYTLNGTDWITNPGANVGTSTNPGNTNTLIKGGYIHEAYGASNSKGTIFGDVMIDTGTTDAAHAACPVQVEKLVAAGKDADVNGDLKVILGCKDAIKIPIVYGGADNANVNGNVELTITSGHFGQVFGGNNLGGAIRGHIILNIEETSDCEPIRIDELYLGGNQASYSKFGYYIKTTTSEGENATGKGAFGETPELKNDKLVFMPRKSKDDPHYPVDTYNHETKEWTVITDKNNYPEYADPVMNLISCTEATEVFGGGFGEGGDMYANPTVNINMIPGKHAEIIKRNGTANPHDLGTIGDVYGGGNQAAVVGNATINIGSANEVTVNSMTYNPTTKVYTSGTATVEGAYITGNVYGGGKLADVTGNTYVNVCAKEADDASTADVIEYKGVTISGTGYEGVTIAGNVFGGGKGIADSFTCAKAMIGVDKENDGKTVITKESTNKGTRVSIGNGTVNGTVYGGGEIGRVEWNTVVTIGLPMGEGETSAPIIRGNVFGAGKGVEPFGYAALVRGNTFVTVQADAKVGQSIYGGGEIASVGKYTIASAEYAASHPEIEEGMPYSLANQGSGYCNVIVRGNAEIGPDGMVMNNTTTGKPDDLGHVFGAGKGVLPYENLATIECQEHPGQHHPGRMAPGNVWECYDGNEAKYLSFVETQALATQTDVTIDGNAFVKGSVYGGSENGHVQHDTHVTIAGGQIGAGEGINKRYTDHYGEWPTETESIETSWKECAHWEYTPNDAAPWDPYAIYESEGKYYYDAAHTQYAEGGAKVGKDGHTFYGNVFGGGSGLLPYAPGKWHRASGSVGGNTQVDITGGHILTSVYGGNEQTDVGTYKKDSKGALVVPVSGGKCTINMTGGTLGVPRTAADAKAHPVTCYLFGAGKGDQRIFFNTWTNVIETEVNIGGDARIYGSTFGGGEDGHVIRDAETNIGGSAIIGTTGTSYVDGNVFGGGRGFSGDAQTAGTVGGNVKVNISGGKMLGNIYGGGRLASVGTMFTAPDDPNYGNFVEDGTGENAKTYGHVAVNISGGIIGNTVGNAESGNVFGGSMGRLTLLDGTTINPIWPKMAQVKEAKVTISGNAVIKRTVYGGGELGTVRDNATVNINGGTVNRDVYGAGYGSKDYETKTKIEVKVPKEGVTNPTSASDYDDVSYVFTPMIFAGCVGQNTYVNIAGGQVKKSVYGGGEMASVGIMDCRVKIDNNATDPVYTEGTDKYVYEHFHSHLDENNGFALSWPFHFENAPGYFGETHVNITGGRIGVANGDTDINTDNGDVYGGGKGIAGEYKNYVYCANVGSAEVIIDYPAGNTATPQNYMTNADIECIAGAVYGGAENGHVMGDTKLTLKNGLIGHSMYGGGSGKGTFSTTLLKIGSTSEHYTRDIYSFTAGKVFGNSTVEMSGGTVVRNVYGGGNMGSVGKGNYAGGADDYSTSGYGETLTGNLWDNANDYSKAFLGSGKCTVNITGGTVGYIDESDPSNSMYPWNSTASLPYGNVFGGCRGESAPNIVETPRYLYSPEFFVGYANETAVTIGKTDGSGPTILGSVYGGGMDGHIRRDASVTILGGEIGIPFTEANKTKVKTSDLNDIQWLARGNVYGSGSGIGKYKYDFDYDGKYESTVKYNNGRATVDTKEEDYSTSAGSVTRFTTVDIKGGTIHRNVYGGGSLSSIGAPKIGQSYDPYHPGDSEHSSEVGKQSLNKVTISGGHIGDADCLTSGYGGDVNGGSRGAMAFENSLANPASFANSVYTEVTISDDADVKGNVFGGGEAGIVKHDTEVKMQGGTVGNDLYGAGDMADVGGNTVVDMTGGTIKHDAFGGARGTADVAAEVKGNATVTLNGTKFIPTFDTSGILTGGRIFGANNVNGTPKGHVKVHVLQTVDSAKDPSVALADRTTYDVGAVYGGGNNADYRPTSTSDFAEVIIDGCEKTSIKYVFGGGNAAATPANDVKINGCYIIDNVFGGGNGTVSPANVGYDETDYKTVGTAVTNLSGGYIHNVYGGSNNQGNILGGASVTNEKYTGPGCCETLQVEEIYGGGKQADMFGGAEIILGCMPNDWIGAIYAGAEHADIGGDIGLTLTSGKFDRVFGGNKSGGVINGYIEVNIEENPECGTPIIIGELYGGGNEAAYTYPHLDKDPNYLSPRVNVRAFTSIGTIFGGGLGKTATVTGNPWVNINEVAGGREYAGETRTLEDGTKVTLYERKADGKMGVIGTVFGGGNAAPVIGNPRVEIGTAAKQKMLSLQTKDAAGTVHEVEKDVLGADIRGNVYGGGNNAAVTGDPKVVIGQRKE